MTICAILIKKILPPHFWLRKKLSQIYHHPFTFFRRPNIGSIDREIERLSRVKSSVIFVQIGANDGVTSDPIFPFIQTKRFCGVKIEPVFHIFLKLKENFKNFPCIKCLNIAIAEKNGHKPFYRLKQYDEKGNKILHNQQGSFIRDHLLPLGKFYPNIDELIEVDMVETWTLRKLFDYIGGTVDLLHIDAEGYDYIILKQLQFCNCLPDLVIFENSNLSNKDYFEACSFLRGRNYVLSECFGDTIARKIKPER